MQSYQAWRLIEEGEYRYDPGEHHGPLLYFVTKWMYPFISRANGELTDEGMRRVPMLFSMGTVFLGLLVFRKYGRADALLWGMIVAAAPLCVIYGSYYVQEALLVCFTLGFAFGIYRYWQYPSMGAAVGVGIALGLMHITKETAVLHVAAIMGAGLITVLLRSEKPSIGLSGLFRHLGVVAGIALLLHCLFFSSFFQNPKGIVDGFATFFSYAERSQGQGHEKPFFYYASLLLPQRLEGVRWSELAFLIATLLGVVGAVAKLRADGFRFFIVGSGLLMFFVYSIIPYKNPWLMLAPYCFLAFSAAIGVVEVLHYGRSLRNAPGKWGVVVCGLGLLFWLTAELRQNHDKALVRYASASRNPYLYMHTTPRYSKLLDRLESVKGLEEIAVYSPDAAWPLPWHLRGWTKVGYWTDLNSYQAGGIDVFDTRLMEGQEHLAASGGFWELHGLRPNTILALRATDERGESWVSSNAED
ncbi:glycosyltransferase family 39 protein [Pelagicoccus mobilis]|uniref:Glycosyltransferase family 39 protein n=1 Tax=Pelagicoccus mobilis TaxID=415221 RepID=A0A934VSP5_9BACT|nr:glycosyltransferase family 39 protein [Pelagicoccus mobilis]